MGGSACRRAGVVAACLAALVLTFLPGCALLMSDKGGVPNPPASAEEGQVFLFAGFTFPGDTPIRSGMYRMTQEVRAEGVRAEFNSPWNWEDAARKLIADPEAARTPIAVVGYSLGGGSATKFANRLRQAGIAVDTLVVVEALGMVPLGCNVRLAADIYNSDSFLSLSSRFRPAPDFGGSLDEIHFSKLTEGRHNLNHWSIAFFDSVRRMVRELVLDGHQVRHRPPSPNEERCLAQTIAG